MALVIIIDFVILAGLVYLTLTKGLEAALPFFTFVTILVPGESSILVPGLFGLTSQRFAVTVLIILYLVFGRRGPAEQRKVGTPLAFLLLLNLIWNIVSAAHSIDQTMSAKQLLSVIFEYYVVYFIFFRSITSPETIERITKAIVYAMGVTVVFGSIEAYTGWSVISWFPPALYRFATEAEGGAVGRGMRTQSTFPHAILYGSALAMVIPQTLYLIANAQSKFRKLVLWIICLLMFLCLYKTASRGPWLAAIFGTALVFFFTYKRVRKYMLVIVALSVTVMIVRPGVYDTIIAMYDATFNPENPMGSSYEYRYALMDVAKAALSKSTDRAFWGYGQESFFFLHLTGPFLGKDDHRFESCDSTWIQSMIETGYVGFGIFALLLGSAALLTLRNVWRLPPGPAKYLSWIFFVNLVQYYFMMVSVALYAWGQNGYMLWFIIAMSMSYPKVLAATTAPAGALNDEFAVSKAYARN